MTSQAAGEISPEEYKTPIARPLLIGAGGVVLVAIMLITAFSLGAWWANGQETSPATFGFGGGGPPPGQGFGQQNQTFAPQTVPGAQNTDPALTSAAVDKLPRSADVVGTITAYGRNMLTVATRAGTRFVTVDSETRIYRPDGSDGTAQALARGGGIAIVTKPSADGRSLVAEVIALLAP